MTKPGGTIQVADPDWETMTVDVLDRNLYRKILQFKVDQITNGWMGRQIYRLMRQAGLENVAPFNVGQPFFSTDLELSDKLLGLFSVAESALQDGVITSQEHLAWNDALKTSAASGTFYASMNGAGVMGTKPVR